MKCVAVLNFHYRHYVIFKNHMNSVPLKPRFNNNNHLGYNMWDQFNTFLRNVQVLTEDDR